MPSSFQKNQTIPFPVTEGGTGVTSLTDKGVLIGAGTGNVTSVTPGIPGNVLKSDGTDWTSGSAPAMADGTVTYAKIATDLIQIVDVASGTDIDWSLGGIYTKTLTANTTLTFSNYKLNKMILLKVTGNYTLGLPTTVKNIVGTYDGTVLNYISLHCTKTTSKQEVWATISQRLPTYGYFAGGYTTSAAIANTNRIVFSTGVTSANTISNLSQARGYSAGVSDCSLYGYAAGGYTGAAAGLVTADKIVFSTGVTSVNTVSNLSQARYGLTGLSDGSNYGYLTGGYTGANVTTADRIVFSSGVTSVNTVSNLSQARRYPEGVSDGSIYGYFAGGYTSTYVATAERIVFSSGATSANTASNLSAARYAPAGLSDGSTNGYFAGGVNSIYDVITTDRIVFSTGITSVNTVSNLSQGRGHLSAISDGLTHGYFSGGYTTNAEVLTTDRIIFSTGVTSANTVSNLSSARYAVAGLSDCAV